MWVYPFFACSPLIGGKQLHPLHPLTDAQPNSFRIGVLQPGERAAKGASATSRCFTPRRRSRKASSVAETSLTLDPIAVRLEAITLRKLYDLEYNLRTNIVAA